METLSHDYLIKLLNRNHKAYGHVYGLDKIVSYFRSHAFNLALPEDIELKNNLIMRIEQVNKATEVFILSGIYDLDNIPEIFAQWKNLMKNIPE